MPPDAPSGGVVFVHAHPDDESISSGGAIARLLAEGRRVDLVTCTDGAEGEIHDPDLDPAEARPRLAEIRRRELACSVDALGGGALRLHLLGYRDSGMMGTESNENPESFWKADLEEATRRLVEIVRAARPAAIVSYDENGGYGHPDHINAARIARDAYGAAGDPTRWPDAGQPHAVERFYEIAWSREAWSTVTEEMRRRGIELPWSSGDERDESEQTTSAEESAERDEFGRPDAVITTRLDVSAHLDRKRRSMECHRTQRQDLGWLLDLPADLALQVMTPEHFVLRWRGGRDVDPAAYREDSLVPS